MCFLVNGVAGMRYRFLLSFAAVVDVVVSLSLLMMCVVRCRVLLFVVGVRCCCLLLQFVVVC